MGDRREGDRTGGPTVIGAFRTVLFGRNEDVVVDECRRCGTTLESRSVTCPHCECDDVVTYRIR